MNDQSKPKEIKLTSLHRGRSSTTFTGRPQGIELRNELDLDKLDQDEQKYVIIVPPGTSSINPSFYLGLFFQSYKKLGGVDSFKGKYSINFEETDSELTELLQYSLADCEREAKNEFEGKTGLDSIF